MGGAQELLRRLAVEQRKRLAASLLNAAEEMGWTQQQREVFRRKVFDSVGSYHEWVLDVIKVSDADDRNEHTIQMLNDIHAMTSRLEGQLAGQRRA